MKVAESFRKVGLAEVAVPFVRVRVVAGVDVVGYVDVRGYKSPPLVMKYHCRKMSFLWSVFSTCFYLLYQTALTFKTHNEMK